MSRNFNDDSVESIGKLPLFNDSHTFNEFDRRMMRRAIQLARYGEGFVSPNPLVGAVIAAPDGRIIGEGWHRKYGGPHAEVNAVASVRSADRHLLKESTIYVTLEPCSHYGKTPPCAKLLIREGFRRVVVGSTDPFKEVAGRGIRMLREAGATVDVGLLRSECESLNPHFLTAHATRRPHVTLKWAMSSDGFMAGAPGEERVIFSSPLSMMAMHRLRASADAIFAGTDTIIADDPSLDTRLWPGDSPRPATFDSPRLPESARIMGRNPILRHKGETLSDFLSRIYREEKITSIMVEGGRKTLAEYLQEVLFDIIRIEISPARIGKGIKAPLMESVSHIGQLLKEERIGQNIILTFGPNH